MAQTRPHTQSATAYSYKRFYARFQPYRTAFINAIQGIPDEQQRQTYGQRLVQRLLFAYFLQQHGHDHKGRNELRPYHIAVRAQFIAPFVGRDTSGPYDVTIADSAFMDLFTFFDTYHWQLTSEEPQTEQTLSPAILGYVFEQQINQKQMGAYYTSDDVTEYVARTTIIPCLFQKLARAHPDLFSAHAAIWQRVRDEPERYIPSSLATRDYLPTETEHEYALRRQCYTQLHEQLSTGTVCVITALVTLNLDIQCFAVDALTACDSPILLLSCYSALTHMSILDPTCGTGAFLCAAANALEVLYTACLQRLQALSEHGASCEEIHTILRKVATFPNLRYASIHTILTHNLYGVDIMPGAVEICRQRLLLILLAHAHTNSDGRNELRPYNDTVRAQFIAPFAAMANSANESTSGDGRDKSGMVRAQFIAPFVGHDGRDKSGPYHIVNHGVVRAQFIVPDLSNTIRVGNALYGVTSAQEMAHFPTQHTTNEGTPFHWHHEFPTVMERGGFDVIIGNPPYIEHSKLPSGHNLYGYTKYQHSNLYAAVLERSLALCRDGQSYLGLIVPISLCTSTRFASLRQTIMQKTKWQWFANFEIFPCRLFEGAFQRLCLLIAQCRGGRPQGSPPAAIGGRYALPVEQYKGGRPQGSPPPSSSAPVPTETEGNAFSPTMHVTKLQRWYTAERPHLIATMHYTRVQHRIHQHMFPKLVAPIHEAILEKLSRAAQGDMLATCLSSERTQHVVYYQEATNYWVKATCSTPFYKKNGVVQAPPHGRFLFFHDAHTAQTGMALLNSGLFYLWFATYSDGFHLAHALVKAFPTGQDFFRLAPLSLLAQRLEQDILQNAQMCTRNTKTGDDIEIAEYLMACSKPLLDQIDSVLAQYYGLEDAEYDFIISYDSKYRLSRGRGSNS